MVSKALPGSQILLLPCLPNSRGKPCSGTPQTPVHCESRHSEGVICSVKVWSFSKITQGTHSRKWTPANLMKRSVGNYLIQTHSRKHAKPPSPAGTLISRLDNARPIQLAFYSPKFLQQPKHNTAAFKPSRFRQEPAFIQTPWRKTFPSIPADKPTAVSSERQ